MERGSILAIILTRFPAAQHEKLSLPEGDFWAEIPDVEQNCPRCSGRSITIIRLNSFNPLTGVAIYCAPEAKLHKLVDLGHGQIQELGQRAREFMALCDVDSMKVLSIDEAQNRGYAARPSEPNQPARRRELNLEPLVASVPIPDGYGLIGWLKKHEAEAVIMAYELSRSFPVITPTGDLVFQAKYRAGSKDAQKYRAKVQGIRMRKDGREKPIGWIREVEAMAALEALEAEQTIERTDSELKVTALIQFFPKGSIEEKTFKSCIQVLRKF